MKRMCAGIIMVAGTVLQAGASYVLANEPKGEVRLIIAGSPASITY